MVNLEVINNLWLEIDKLHLSYLQTEESPERIQQKRKLKGYMKEYLCLVTANQRFYSPTTKAVLYTSILKKGDQFSSSKFSHAWEMLGMYAANLLGQPWRKEFKEIRLYSGGYKYQIEHHLLGAEDILMEMGYTLDIEYNRLIVQGILDYDRIVRCHRDCLLAQVESEVLSEIHSTMNSNPMKPCNWGTIFDYRDKYVGSVNHCVRGLMYQQAQKETMYYPYNPQPPPLTPMAGFLGPHEMYPTNFTYPMMYHQPYLKPSYPYTPPMPLKEVNKNLAQTPEEYESRYQIARDPIVKAKALEKPKVEQFDAWENACNVKSIPKFEDLLDIERLERMIYDDVDNIRSSKKSNQEAVSKEKRSLHSPDERAMPSFTLGRELNDTTERQSLMRARESNDATERQNLNRAREANDTTERQSLMRPREANDAIERQSFTRGREINDAIERQSFTRGREISDAIERQNFTRAREVNGTAEKQTLRSEEALALQAENIYSKKPARLSPNPHSTAQTLQPESLPVKKPMKSSPSPLAVEMEQEMPRPEPRRRGVKETRPAQLDNRWECLFCTFCNVEDRDICEMCSKSRNMGPEVQPLQRGGRECSNCTLVNPPDERVCAACSSSLNDAPTYI